MVWKGYQKLFITSGIEVWKVEVNIMFGSIQKRLKLYD